MIFRRSGVVTASSDSAVVNPAREKADNAWKEAASRDRPVIISATAPIRTTSMESETMANREMIANIG